MRKFDIEVYMYSEFVSDCVLYLHEEVINTVDDEWRSVFYDLYTPEQIASHIAYNLIINEIELSQMDGWANLPNEYAYVNRKPYLDHWDIGAEEIKDVEE